MSQVALQETTIEALRSAIGGDVIAPGHPAYEEARLVWNGMVDKHPALVARCASAADVATAVKFGREHDLVIAVRGGSHSTPGYSTCDGGIVIDLRPMNQVHVDPDSRTARVGGGANWGELDAAAQEHGLAVTGGRVSDTGVGGLATGSGSGWLERMYGVTPQSLLAAEVVTADGNVVTAGPDENSDLFWGLRGGGSNFGVVTEFRFQLHPVGPIVMAGMLLYPRAQAPEVMRFYRDFMEQAPDEVCGGVALLTAPPEDFIPEGLRGQPAVGIVFVYIGPVEDGEQAVRPLREGTSPVLDIVQPMPYAAMQQMLDAGNPRGIREYFKVDWLRELSDEAIDVVVEQGQALAAPFGQVILAPMGGAVARTDDSVMALNVPGMPWAYFCLNMWMDPSQDEQNIAWARGFAALMLPFGIGKAAFPNFIAADEGVERLRASYGPEKYDRLVALKRKWDPDNVFRLNQNINPAA
jgi:FAD/FMN-containing dehydrogenase